MDCFEITENIIIIFRFKIRVGDFRLNSKPNESDAQVLDVVKINKHPEFDGESSYFDIAIFTTKPVNFSKVFFLKFLKNFIYRTHLIRRQHFLVAFKSAAI